MTDNMQNPETGQNPGGLGGPPNSAIPQPAAIPPSANLSGGSSTMSHEEAFQTTAQPEGVNDSGLQISNVSLLTQGDVGIVEIPGLNIEFDSNGLNILKTSGDLVKLLPWDSLLDIYVEDYRYSPVDPVAASMVVATARRSHQFRLRGQDAKVLAQKLSVVAKEFAGSQGLVDDHNNVLSESLPYIAFAGMVVLTVLLVLLHASGHLAI